MDVGKLIASKRKELNLTLHEVAEYVGVTDSTILRWETGNIQNMKRDKIKLLSEILKVSPMVIMGWEEGENPNPARTFPQLLEIGKKRFPLFSGIACGEPLPMDETIETYVSSTTDLKADFVIRAVGESMQPGIHDGDLVFIRSQPMVENGEIAAVAIGDEATLKRVYWYASDSIVVLRPDNPSFKELVYKGPDLEEVHILGKAIAYQRDVK